MEDTCKSVFYVLYNIDFSLKTINIIILMEHVLNSY